MKQKISFACTECGHETSKWYGKCPSCGSWNTMAEFKAPPVAVPGGRGRSAVTYADPVALSRIDTAEEMRLGTGIGELDRVLGGGAVTGSLVLVGGEPGIGKSTLLLQVSANLCAQGSRVLYVSGEESLRQLKLRADRLRIDGDHLLIQAQTRLEDILHAADTLSPQVMIVDSIQTVYKSEVSAAPGSVSQIKDCALSLLQYAKANDVLIFVVGHVTKEGTLAGPKILEHMVDCVLYFEGDRHMSYRIVRAAKNRFGSTNEIGVFEMTSDGLRQVPNPSEALLAGRPKDVPGSCIACILEGSRPLLAEIQALVAPMGFGTPRRMSAGFDYNRAMLLLAVLEKRAGLFMGSCDTYINVTGGLKIDEPAADLPAVLALASSVKDKPLRANLAAFGEVGLTGELRAVSGGEQRLAEIQRLGFKYCVLPASGANGIVPPRGLKLLPAAHLREALELALATESSEQHA